MSIEKPEMSDLDSFLSPTIVEQLKRVEASHVVEINQVIYAGRDKVTSRCDFFGIPMLIEHDPDATRADVLAFWAGLRLEAAGDLGIEGAVMQPAYLRATPVAFFADALKRRL